MVQNITLCSRFGVVPKCKHCNDQNCIKNGKTSNGKQRYQCNKCGKKFITEYTYQAYNPNINRLTEAWYQVPGTGVNHSYDEYLAYDRNGNITALERYGEFESASTLEKIDNLVYDYDDGNKLINVTDETGHPAGFDDGNIHNESGNDDFEYDAFGNLVIDRNKDITSVSYNHLNLPKKVVFHEGESEILYLYDANGVKMEKITKQEHQVIKKVNYQGVFQYTDEEMDFIHTAEGYTKVTHSEENIPHYNYVFNYTDHLGNVRVSWTQNPEAPEELVIIDDNHYYPFGLRHKGYQSHPQVHYWATSFQQVALTPVSSLYPVSFKYKFGGKELQTEFGVGMYDFGARNYDPALGRWMNIDPLAEKMTRHSPYNYAFDNPVFFIDPDGMEPIASFGNGGLVPDSNFMGTGDSFTGFNVTTSTDSKFVTNLDNVNVGMDGKISTGGAYAATFGAMSENLQNNSNADLSGGGGCPPGVDCDQLTPMQRGNSSLPIGDSSNVNSANSGGDNSYLSRILTPRLEEAILKQREAKLRYFSSDPDNPSHDTFNPIDFNVEGIRRKSSIVSTNKYYFSSTMNINGNLMPFDATYTVRNDNYVTQVQKIGSGVNIFNVALRNAFSFNGSGRVVIIELKNNSDFKFLTDYIYE